MSFEIIEIRFCFNFHFQNQEVQNTGLYVFEVKNLRLLMLGCLFWGFFSLAFSPLRPLRKTLQIIYNGMHSTLMAIYHCNYRRWEQNLIFAKFKSLFQKN